MIIIFLLWIRSYFIIVSLYIFFPEFRAIQASLALYQESGMYPMDDESDEDACRRRRNGRRNGQRNGADDDEDVNDEIVDVSDIDIDTFEDTAEQMRLALRLSEQQQIEDEQRRLLEEETFRQVLELSLTDKWTKKISKC